MSSKKAKAPEASGKSATGRKVIKRVTAAVLKFKEGEPRVVKIVDKMHISTRKGGDEGGKKKMEPATICNGVDVNTGEEGVIICNKVLAGNLAEQYPDDSYVGKVFEITVHAKKKGAKFDYRPVDITEVEA